MESRTPKLSKKKDFIKKEKPSDRDINLSKTISRKVKELGEKKRLK